MITRAAALLAQVLLFSSCVPQPSRDPSARDTADEADQGPSLLQKIQGNPGGFVREVAAARELQVRAEVPFTLDDDATFNRHLLDNQSGADNRMLFGAFGLPTGEPSAQGRAQAHADQVLAFFNPKNNEIHVRRSALRGDRLKQGLLVAHEVEHALQHQNLDLDSLRKATSSDESLARLALAEGDAQLAGLAYLASTIERPLRRVLFKVAEHLDEQTRSSIVAADPRAKGARLSEAELEVLQFPYTQGLLFAGALHRAGGFRLVSGAFGKPPVSTEQILHPEKYLAGELPIEVATPPAPPGARALATGTMGELGTGMVLARCSGREQARSTASGWGGDAFSIWKNPDGALTLAWSTAWDDEASADFFAQTLEKGADCWARAPAPEAAPIRGPYRVLHKGRRVAAVRGASPADPSALLTSLLSLPRPPRPKAPPFGAVEIPPPRPQIKADRGQLRGYYYDNATLGLQAALPPGSSVEIDTKDLSVTAKVASASGSAHFTIGMADAPFSEKTRRKIALEVYNGVRKGLENVLPDARPHIRYQGPARTSLGDGWAMEWGIPETHVFLRVVVLPICEQTGALWLLQFGTSEAMRPTLDAALHAMSWTTPEPPVCNELNPLGSFPAAARAGVGL